MKINIETRLKIEQEKLNDLVDEALENGTPISETYEVMDQCKKIRRLAADALQDERIQTQSRKVDEILGKMD